MSMDNLHVSVTSEGADALLATLRLFNQKAACGYRVEQKRIIFYWAAADRKDYHQFPFRMTIEQVAQFALTWLSQADYGKEPDHDGDNGKGWKCYCEGWGHVASEYQAFAAVEPAWAMYGK